MTHLLPLTRALALGLLALAALPVRADVPPTLSFDEVRAGMRGEGRTVFAGTTIETFEVEILGKLENVGPDQDLILGRCTGGPLADTGVMSGMSGSPVFVDGKLIGAVAYSWGFAKDAIAGITPIEEMLAIGERADTRRAAAAAAGWEPEAAALLAQPAALDDFFRSRWRRLTAGGAGPLQASVPLAVAGMRAGVLAELFGEPSGTGPGGIGGGWHPVQTGSAGSAADAPAPALRPGSAMGVKLVRGDVEMSATGTVTWVDGPRVLGFGHPLFGLGPVDLPLTGARVEALMPSLQQSAKIAVPTAESGALRQDRAGGVAGSLGARPRMIPVRLQMRGPSSGEATYSFDVADDAALSPVLLYTALNGVLANRERSIGNATVRLLRGSTIKLADGTDVTLENTFAGPSGIQLGTAISAYVLHLLMNNPWSPPRVAGVNLILEYEDVPRTARVRRLTVGRYRVRPGEPFDVDVVLAPYAGAPRVIRRTLTIPEGTPAGPLTLTAGGAAATSRTEGGGRGVQPESLEQLVEFVNRLRRNDRLYLVATRRDEGAVLGARRLPNLPTSAATILSRPRTRGNVRFLPVRGVVDDAVSTEFAVEGSASVLLEVVAE